MSVVVLGSINTDLIAKVARRPNAGETLLAADFKISPGGKGANQALAARRMGAQVSILAAVGHDPFAETALQFLRADGVDLSGVLQLEDCSTGIAMIQLDAQGENSITVVPGANSRVGDTALQRLDDVLSPSDILLVQLETPLEIVQKAIAIAQRKGARVLVDPAPAPASLPTDLCAVDVFMPNQTEAETILGRQIPDVEQGREAAYELHQQGAHTGIIKLGAQGVVWATAGKTFFEPAHHVHAIDTTGAGDAFAGALAAFLDRGHDMATAIARANKVAALSTTRLGAQESFPYQQEA